MNRGLRLAKLRIGLIGFIGLMAFASFAAMQAAAQKRPPAKPVELNTATQAQLEGLPGIGPATAQAIIRFRQKSGPFQRAEDLLAIRGISKKRLAALRPYVKVTPVKKAAAQEASRIPRN